MRIASTFITGALAGGLALAAGRSESITYVDGNLTGLTPKSMGTLSYASGDALELKAGSATAAVPYAGIAKAELGVAQQHASGTPLYKVWDLRKHFSKVETQLLTVDFKNDQGDAKTMTLELGAPAANNVLNAIKLHNQSVETTLAKAETPAGATNPAGPPKQARTFEDQKPGDAKGDWWGDSVWKTGRNSDKWEKAPANAPE